MKTKIFRSSALAIVLLAALFVVLPQPALAAACTFTSNVSGTWTTAGSWTPAGTLCSNYPGQTFAGDIVVIVSGDTITLNVSPANAIASLTVGGTFNMNGAATTNRTLSVTGDVIINSPNGVIQPTNQTSANVHTLNIGGNFTNNDTFTSLDTDDIIGVVLNGSAAQTIGGSSIDAFQSLTTSGLGTKTLGGNVTVNGTLTLTAGTLGVGANTLAIPGLVTCGGGSISSGATGTVNYSRGSNGQNVCAGTYGILTFSNFNKVLASSGTIGIAGTFNDGTATGHTVTGSTIDFNGSGAQTIPSFTYNNLTTSNTGVKDTGGESTINGNAIVGSGTTLLVSGNTLTLGNNSVLTVNGTLEFTGDGILQTGSNLNATLTMASAGSIRTDDIAGLGPTTPATLTSLRVQGTGVWTLTSLATTGTVEYYSGSDQSVTDRDYNNLILSGTTTVKTWTRAANRTVNGNLTFSSSTAFTLNGNFTLNVGGNWTHSSSGAFTTAANAASIVNFNRTGTSTLSRTTASGLTETFCNLTISANTVLDTTDDFIAVSAGGGCGTLTTDGVFRRTPPASTITTAGGTFTFQDSLNNVTVDIDQTSGTNMGSTTVIVSGHVVSDTASFPCGTGFLGG